MRKSVLEDTIVAVSTPIGEGGIGIVRLSGPRALQIADRIFVSKDGKKPSRFKTYTTHYGHVIESVKVSKCQSVKEKIVDEVILTVMRAPKSYTKEDIVEINCHGGIQATKKVLDLVMSCGARAAEPGEFTKRAFLNGRIDLAQAEAVLDVIRAKTEGSLKVSVDQLEGELSREINRLLDEAVSIASQIEASIDFPDEELETAERDVLVKRANVLLNDLKHLSHTYDEGVLLREGVLAIICGKPNTGKSSLMNLLLKRDRVIVSPVPGTTRDAVEEMISLKGIPIRLVDTAGIAEMKDPVGKEGVNKTRKYLKMADIAIFMLDASSGVSGEDTDILKMIGDKPKVVVINKCDLAGRIDMKEAKRLFKKDKIVEISVKNKTNIALLERTLYETVWRGDFTQGEGSIVANARHKELLDKSIKNMLSVKDALEKNISPELVSIDLKEAIHSTGLIIGKSVSSDILDRIFEQFCIGK